MNSLSPFDPEQTPDRGRENTLDASLSYDDLTTGLRAQYLLGHKARLFTEAPHLSSVIWRFDLLGDSSACEMALSDAFAAVIVLLTSHWGRALPEFVRPWLEQWFRRRNDDPCAMIVSLVEIPREAAASAQIFFLLQTGGGAKRVALFPRFSPPPGFEGGLVAGEISTHFQTTVAILEDIQRRTGTHSRWGINE